MPGIPDFCASACGADGRACAESGAAHTAISAPRSHFILRSLLAAFVRGSGWRWVVAWEWMSMLAVGIELLEDVAFR